MRTQHVFVEKQLELYKKCSLNGKQYTVCPNIKFNSELRYMLTTKALPGLVVYIFNLLFVHYTNELHLFPRCSSHICVHAHAHTHSRLLLSQKSKDSLKYSEISTLTYQICRTEEKINRTTTFHKQDLSPDRIARLILHILFLEISESVTLILT